MVVLDVVGFVDRDCVVSAVRAVLDQVLVEEKVGRESSYASTYNYNLHGQLQYQQGNWVDGAVQNSAGESDTVNHHQGDSSL